MKSHHKTRAEFFAAATQMSVALLKKSDGGIGSVCSIPRVVGTAPKSGSHTTGNNWQPGPVSGRRILSGGTGCSRSCIERHGSNRTLEVSDGSHPNGVYAHSLFQPAILERYGFPSHGNHVEQEGWCRCRAACVSGRIIANTRRRTVNLSTTEISRRGRHAKI